MTGILPATVTNGSFLARLHEGHDVDPDILERDARDTCLPHHSFPAIVADELWCMALYDDRQDRCRIVQCLGRGSHSHMVAALASYPLAGAAPVTLVRVADLAEVQSGNWGRHGQA